MKKIVSLLIGIFLSSTQVWGQTLLIRSPQVSAFEFSQFIEAHKEFTAFRDHVVQKIQNNLQQENQFLQLTDTFAQDLDTNLTTIKKLEEKSPLTLISLRFLRDYTEKMLGEKISSEQRTKVLHLYCKTGLLLQEGPLLHPCQSRTIDLFNIRKKNPTIEKILIEGRVFNYNESISVSMNTPYHWNLVSDSHKPFHFYGTYEQLNGQQFSIEDLIAGNCTEYSPGSIDFEDIHRSQVYFDQNCIKKLSATEDKKSQFSIDRPLLYGAGALVLGGLILLLKDKNMVIEHP